ncbi:MAG: diguanylate cyclase [Planctomycetota bacterium]
MPTPGQRTSRNSPAPTPTGRGSRRAPQRVEAAALRRPVVVVGDVELADRVQLLLNGAAAQQPEDAPPPAAVLRVPSFLSALGEAAKSELAAVIGPVRALSGMAASTAESLRKLAPHARLILLQPAAAGHPHAQADDEDARLALDAGFDHALPSDPDLPALAQALDLPLPQADPSDVPREPALRRADPHDLSTLDLGPATAVPPAGDRSNQRPGTAALQEASNPPAYQATLDAALPSDLHDPPPATPIAPSTGGAAGDHPAANPGGASLGDTDLVNLVLRGEGGMKDMAVSMIRAQSGLPDVNFYEATEAPAGFAQSSVAVAQCDQTFGCLTCSDPDAGPQLAVWADWLVHWLRLEAQFNRLRDLAMKDELTGVWNRRYFNHFLKKILDRAAAGRQQVTLLLFDIDDFKLYNDAYGHAAGDEILQGVANLMRSSVREHDVVARIGGDEFAVIFWDAGQEPRTPNSKHPDDVLNAAKRFQKAVVDHRFPKLLDKAAGTLTISGGLAGFPWDGRTPEELLEAADTMAMQSKQQGKNAITFGPGAQVDPDTAP